MRLELSQQDKTAQIDIDDDGRGVEREDLSQVRDPHRLAAHPLRRLSSGRGAAEPAIRRA